LSLPDNTKISVEAAYDDCIDCNDIFFVDCICCLFLFFEFNYTFTLFLTFGYETQCISVNIHTFSCVYVLSTIAVRSSFHL
jgi:hypothetical protein